MYGKKRAILMWTMNEHDDRLSKELEYVTYRDVSPLFKSGLEKKSASS